MTRNKSIDAIVDGIFADISQTRLAQSAPVVAHDKASGGRAPLPASPLASRYVTPDLTASHRPHGTIPPSVRPSFTLWQDVKYCAVAFAKLAAIVLSFATIFTLVWIATP